MVRQQIAVWSNSWWGPDRWGCEAGAKGGLAGCEVVVVRSLDAGDYGCGCNEVEEDRVMHDDAASGAKWYCRVKR